MHMKIWESLNNVKTTQNTNKKTRKRLTIITNKTVHIPNTE